MGAGAKAGPTGSSPEARAGHRRALVAATFALALFLLIPPAAQAEAPPPFWGAEPFAHPENRVCPVGPGAGQCDIPRGIAVSEAPGHLGHLYVADQSNDRIDELTAWGAFVRSYGWGVKDGAEEAQSCGPPEPETSPPSALCRAGLRGAGAAQLSAPQGIAVDSAGDLYVAETGNNRVQKLGPEGEFLLMFGGGVNETSGGNLCPRPGFPADACKAGSAANPGPGEGQFGSWPISSFIGIDTNETETAADDVVYVGDQNRVQEFNTGGEFLGQLTFAEIHEEDPAFPETGQVGSLAVDSTSGDLYIAFNQPPFQVEPRQPDVFRVDPATAGVLDTIDAQAPTALATDSEGNLYAFEEHIHKGSDFNPENRPAKLVEYDSSGEEVATIAENKTASQETEFENSNGIAAGSACFSAGRGVYLANWNLGGSNSFVRAWSAPPDNPECPAPAAAPSIDAQWAASVGSEEASVRAQLNPHYWSGSQGQTDYYVQYATAQCIEEGGWEAGCVKAAPTPPGTALEAGVLNADVTTAGVFLGGLGPATAYRYRFAASNTSPPPGGPEAVFGVGGTPTEDGKAGSFTTFPASEPPNEGCPNQALRTGPSAALPDCRAYEMVSPVDKEGGDIAVGPDSAASPHPAAYYQSEPAGEAITYSSGSAFAGAASGPYSNQYIARRGAGGWASESISPPQEGPLLIHGSPLFAINTAFRAFSADLSEAWLTTFTEPALAAGAPAGYANTYRRENGTGKYEACTTVPQDEAAEIGYVGPKFQGASAEGRHGFFRIEAKLTPNAAGSPGPGELWPDQIYECSYVEGGARRLDLVSVLPSGAASKKNNAVGSASEGWSNSLGHGESLAGAIAADGARVYWTASEFEGKPGTLYARSHPDQPESAHSHGTATGTGNLIGPATATGKASLLSTIVKEVAVKSGGFAVGQEITDSEGAIPAATTIAVIEVEKEEEGGQFLKLTLSAKATKNKGSDELVGHASEVVPHAVAASGAFAAGQRLSAPGGGVPAGTTIEAVTEEGEEEGHPLYRLTLSAAATKTGAGAELQADSPCTEADKACTLRVSETITQGNSEFLGANSSGSLALFRVNDNGSAYKGVTQNLYEFDAQSGESTLIAAKVQGVVAHSESLSRVYLVSDEDCSSEGPNERGEEAQAGEHNLYLYEAGESCEAGELAFVARIPTAKFAEGSELSLLSPSPYDHTALATASGSVLAFGSTDPGLAEAVAGHDNTDQATGKPDEEIYRYEAATGKLACVSCIRTGARPSGAASLPTWETSLYARRSLSENGRRIFFESPEALVLADTNGATDVYEWEAPEEGGCAQASPSYVPASGGCLALISSGRSPEDAEFVDASTDGSDVFFTTASSLVSGDPGSVDIYDARIEGGFAEPAPPAPTCEGEACQSAPEAPNDPTPASATFQGAGNVAEEPAKPKCRKGKVRRRGRCVAKHRKHKSTHKRRSRR